MLTSTGVRCDALAVKSWRPCPDNARYVVQTGGGATLFLCARHARQLIKGSTDVEIADEAAFRRNAGTIAEMIAMMKKMHRYKGTITPNDLTPTIGGPASGAGEGPWKQDILATKGIPLTPRTTTGAAAGSSDETLRILADITSLQRALNAQPNLKQDGRIQAAFQSILTMLGMPVKPETMYS
jgi:hypothetical protein